MIALSHTTKVPVDARIIVGDPPEVDQPTKVEKRELKTEMNGGNAQQKHHPEEVAVADRVVVVADVGVVANDHNILKLHQ